MPEIQYPTNPNSDTAFVVQENGTKNRALMTAPQDTSTLELPNNPNSTKGYVTVDGKKHRVVLTADIGGGGGGSVDTSKVVNADVLPTADASNLGQIYMYTGADKAFQSPASFEGGSGATITIDSSVLLAYIQSTYPNKTVTKVAVRYFGVDNFLIRYYFTDDPRQDEGYQTESMINQKGITVSGTPTASAWADSECVSLAYTHGYIYENVATTTPSSASAEQTVGSTLSDIAVDLTTLESFTGWTTDNSLQIFYTADGWSVDTTSLGVTYTGTPNVGDAITITYTAESTTYAWTRVDVQPEGATYAAGTGIDIINNAISVQMPVHYNENNAYAIGISTQLGAFVYNSVAIGTMASAATEAVNIGGQGPVPQGTISIGNFQSTPVEQGVVLFHTQDGNYNYHTYKMLEADGTVPTARLTKVNTTATLVVADWSSSTQTVTVSGVKADSVVFVSPDPTSASDYASAGILCTAQAADSLTFTCTTTPSNAITVNVVCM